MATLALVLLLAAPASKPAKPKVDFKVSPPMAMLGVGPRSSVTVTFRLSIKSGGNEDFYCPRLEWEWQDATMSTEESDCPPFDQAKQSDHDRTWSRSRQFWEPGQHTIKVRLYKGERLIRTVEGKVEVTGEATPARYRER